MKFPFISSTVAATLLATGALATSATSSGAGVHPIRQELSLVFEPNQGQTTPATRFISRSGGHALLLNSNESILLLQLKNKKPETIRMRLEQADAGSAVHGEAALSGHSNYFIGNDPAEWRTGIPHFGKVRYSSIYPGIDLVYYGKEGNLEYDFIVAPGADPNRIRFQVDGTRGLKLDSNGDLVLVLANGEMRHRKPVIYQELAGGRTFVEGRYSLRGNHVAFEVGAYDRNRALIIDPILSWAGYIGGNNSDTGNAIAVDSQGNAYITGQTSSRAGFPVTNGSTFFGGDVPENANLVDAFVTKINSTGTAVVYSTYVGGVGVDVGRAITVNAAGEAYIAGETDSGNFPTNFPGNAPYRGTLSGLSDGFIYKLSASGTPLYSTYIGGSANDAIYAIAVDSASTMYVGGYTTSTNLPNVIAGQGLQGTIDGFVMKIPAPGTQVAFSSYVGGAGNGDYIYGLALDSALNIYVTGFTNSTDLPQTGTFQPGNGGNNDAFVCKLTNGGARLYWTYIGGNQNETGRSIAVDTTGAAYITGETASFNFPTTAGAYQTSFGGGATDAFVVKLNASGTAFGYSTYLGGGSTEEGHGIAVNSIGNAYVAGQTNSSNFPVVNSVKAPGAMDAFVTKLISTGASLMYSTLAGGTDADIANGLALDGAGSAYITGYTRSVFTSSIPGNALGSVQDAFFMKFQDNTSETPAGINVGTLTPRNGSGNFDTFTGTFTHGGGVNQLYLGYILFLPTPNIVNYTATGSCLVEYNRISRGMRLIDNPGTGWLGPIEGIPVGTPGAVLANNQCSVNVQTASATLSGNTMAVTVSVNFNNSMGPVLGTFLQGLDVTGIWTGMTQISNWQLPGAPQNRPGPSISSLQASAQTGSAATYTLTASHTSGFNSLVVMHVRISSEIVDQPACHVVYFPGTNTLNLINQENTALVSPTGVAPGSATPLSNGLCTLNPATITPTKSGNAVSVNFPMTFNPSAFSGGKNVYSNAFDNTGLLTHWVQGATLTVQ